MQFQNQDDKTLVMLTLAGEQRAYEALVARYQRTVIASAARITRSQFMAEDAAQDAFVTAWMKLDTLEEQDKYCSWVCRIAKNCALNMIRRYRGIIPVDLAEYGDIADDPRVNPEYKYVASEEENELHTAVSKLSDKVRTIIQLYYFEGLSIVEIADRMRVSQGTVKWQLHDGRKKIRKELCAMNEKWNDTLVERVMKKVEELKLWQLKNNKDGFEVIYKDVLKDVESLPESKSKYHALADVLHSGWWWLPGTKNDELFESIKKVLVNILGLSGGSRVSGNYYDQKSLLDVIFLVELSVCCAENPACSRAHYRFAELFGNRKSNSVNSRFKRVFACKTRSAVIGQYIYRNMLAEDLLTFCIHLSEKVVFGNGDVFHTVSSFLKEFFAECPSAGTCGKGKYPLQKIKAYGICTGFVFSICFFAN